jgi:hypothetical protein
MNCSECEQLFDAYLDGQLAGSLRLEFDAHRLRCRHCQQTLAMLEAVGHVIASDSQVPELSDDFTARVMKQTRHTPRIVRFPTRRVAIVGAALAQAAAVLLIAVYWNHAAAPVPPLDTHIVADAQDPTPQLTPAQEGLRDLIIEGVEDRIWEMHAAGRQFTNQVTQLARYLDISLPEDIARESSKMAQVNPWQGFWDGLAPAPELDSAQPAPPATETVHSF